MINIPDKVRLVTRNSQLAVWQANHVARNLQALYPSMQVDILEVTTEGDRILDRSLSKVGGKGLFIKELENALLRKEADFAIHSLKDLPANLDTRFTVTSVMAREDPRDAFVSNCFDSLAQLPDNSIVGTSSLRRLSILRKCYPRLQVKLLRGNVLTRLKKLDAFEYDGIILAVAGLKRLGLHSRIREYLDPQIFVPAIAQGSLALELLAENSAMLNLVKPLIDEKTMIEVCCEREVGRMLQASCSVPLAVHAVVSKQDLEVRAFVADGDIPSRVCQVVLNGAAHEYLSVAKRCVAELKQQGIEEILRQYT